ncbi:MAG TPA: phage holin family protein [Solirubrobacterales bacterium]|nr:phage holin family protein [Solirubrobacterales bacterium]
MPEPSNTPPTPPQTPPPVPPPVEPGKRPVGELVFDVTERASSLIREEIELAKAEVTEKVTKLLRGTAVGVAAGVFAFLALILAMEGIAWLLAEEVFDGTAWAGFLVESAAFLLIAAVAGLVAYKAVKAGSPPVPEQAIEEAKLTKEMLTREPEAPAPGPTPEAAPTKQEGAK